VPRNVRSMTVIEAASWGLTGGLVAGLVGLSTAVAAANFRWPWHDVPDGVWPRIFVACVAIVVGGIVAGAAHTQVTGPWPALIMGASAPSVIRGILSGVELTARQAATGHDDAKQ